jgi:hypothetical protein
VGSRYQTRLRAIARTAIEDTIEKAQVPKGDGGRMPIVTGFLRASIQAALHTMPAGPTKGKTGEKYTRQVAGEPVATALLRYDPTTSHRFFVGWTANYARHMDARYSYLSSAVEVWDQTVAQAAKKVGTGLG